MPEKKPPGHLPTRQGAILRIIIGDYVATANPVGSERIAKEHPLGVSPATIRNDMAALEDEGFILHPHTSAGRIPADKGYRYYIEALMEEDSLPVNAQRQIHSKITDWEGELDQWVDLSAELLAQLVSMVTVVTAPKAPVARIKRLELVALQEFLVLMVLVLQEARVLQSVVHVDEIYNQEDLSAAARRLNETLVGLSAPEIQPLIGSLANPFEEQMAMNVHRMVHEEDLQKIEAAQPGGLRHLLSQPEFASHEKLAELLGLLENRRDLGSLLSTLANSDVRAVVGNENPRNEMQELSLIIAPYGIPGQFEGTLAVLGPKRMPYGKVMAAVRYFAQVMSGSLTERYT